MFVAIGSTQAFATDFKDSSGYNPEWAQEQTPERTFQLCDNVLTVDDFADKFDFVWCSEYVTLMKSKGMSMAEIEIPEITYKKYTDEKYGYSFEYPDSWTLELEDNVVYVIDIEDNLLLGMISPEKYSGIDFEDLTGDDEVDLMNLIKYLRMDCNDRYSLYEDGKYCHKFEEIMFGSRGEVNNSEVIEVDGFRTLLISYRYEIYDEINGNGVAYGKFVMYDVKNEGFILKIDNDVTLGGWGELERNERDIINFIRSFTFNKTSSGGGCLIATATYGTELAPQVQLLREIRDNNLLNTESGSAFMGTFNNIYYSFSPTIADWERESPVFKEVVKLAITPMITSLSLMENANSESEVLGIGISLIVLNLGMYLGVPAVVIVGIRKRF